MFNGLCPACFFRYCWAFFNGTEFFRVGLLSRSFLGRPRGRNKNTAIFRMRKLLVPGRVFSPGAGIYKIFNNSRHFVELLRKLLFAKFCLELGRSNFAFL